MDFAGDNIFKTCEKMLNHKLDYHYILRDGVYKLQSIKLLDRISGTEYGWHPYFKDVLINKKDQMPISLPYFEPDFSNYQKLLNKLKLYITFS